MARAVFVFAVGLVAGMVIVRIMMDPGEPRLPTARTGRTDGAGDRADSASAVASPELQIELERERASRRRLEADVEYLEALLAELEGDSLTASGRIDEADDSDETGGSDLDRAPDTGDGSGARSGDASAKRPWFEEGELASLGLSPREIERIRLRWEEYTMETLYLQDARARGDSELTKREHRREMLRLRQELREDLGDDGYDAMLFATGQKNRVILRDVLETSPAFESGFRPGDELIQYGDERVFNPMVLKQLTARGTSGRSVEVLLLRDGELVRLFVPSGPLGIRMKIQVRPPYVE